LAYAGWRVTREQSLQPHYAKTLEHWAANLEAARDRAIELTSREVYDMYMRYLTGCGHYYRIGAIDLVQFSFAKA
jgi:cyclopropane-fatty-acyl-phospholipid synthase